MKLLRISAIWCSSCIITYHIWKELKEKYPSFTFEELDYDSDEEEIKKYQIGKIIPVIIILNDKNVEIGRIIGEKSKKKIIKTIDSLRG